MLKGETYLENRRPLSVNEDLLGVSADTQDVWFRICSWWSATAPQRCDDTCEREGSKLRNSQLLVLIQKQPMGRLRRGLVVYWRLAVFHRWREGKD